MKYFDLQPLQVFKRKGLMIFLFFGVISLFQTSFILASAEEKKIEDIRGSTSLESISKEWGVPVIYLRESLKLPQDVPINTALKELKDKYGFTIEDVRTLVAEYRARGKSNQLSPPSPGIKKGITHDAEKKKGNVEIPLALYGLLCLAMLFLLRKNKISHRLAILILLPSLLIFGVFFQAHPEPMRAVVQFFQSLIRGMYSLPSTLLVFLAFALMTFLGVKLICGWGCPVGTLQEILYRLPLLSGSKKKKIPFWVSNSIRTILFVFFLILLSGLFLGWKEQSLYRYFNPFRLFDWNFRVTAPIFIIIIFGLALINYRPYCMFVCPFGLFSWLIQDFSIFKIRINHNTCLECGKCSRVCPSGAAQGILEGKTFKADCFSCARCLNACPNDSLTYRSFYYGR